MIKSMKVHSHQNKKQINENTNRLWKAEKDFSNKIINDKHLYNLMKHSKPDIIIKKQKNESISVVEALEEVIYDHGSNELQASDLQEESHIDSTNGGTMMA